MAIKCCNGCAAPKRYPGCHDHCPDYQKEKAEYESKKAAADKQKAIKAGLDAHAIAGVYRANRKKGRK